MRLPNAIARRLGRLLHIANSCPPSGKARKDRFYAMKQKILNLFGAEDGHDIQHIPGKVCWNCGGDGLWDEYNECYKCDGTGWHKHPVWVVLKRWKLGGYKFHEPVKRHYREPVADLRDRPVIEGYIEHVSCKWKEIERARFILCLLFDWKPLFADFRNWWVCKAVSRKCHICKKHLWSSKKWQCPKHEHTEVVIEQDADIPF